MKIDGNVTGVYDILKKQKGQLEKRDEVQKKPATKSGMFKKVLSDKTSQVEKPGTTDLARRQTADALKRPHNQLDHVEISRKSQLVSNMMEKVLETPAARAKKIKEIKKKVDEGTYKIDAKKVAEKMIRDGVLDELLRPI